MRGATAAFRFSTWEAGDAFPMLESGEVHVWLGRAEAAAATRAWSYLTDDEQTRAHRFHRAADRRRYVVGRGGLRVLLGRYLDCAPSTIAFHYGARGKPYLNAPASEVAFNTAHAGDRVLWGVTRGAAIGVDIEPIRVESLDAELKRVVLDAAERQWIEALPQDEQAEAFYRCWTLKEALVKATGQGFERSPAEVNVLEAARDRDGAHALGEHPPQRWTGYSGPVVEGYCSAVVHAGDACLVHGRCWTPVEVS